MHIFDIFRILPMPSNLALRLDVTIFRTFWMFSGAATSIGRPGRASSVDVSPHFKFSYHGWSQRGLLWDILFNHFSAGIFYPLKNGVWNNRRNSFFPSFKQTQIYRHLALKTISRPTKPYATKFSHVSSKGRFYRKTW